MAPAASLPQRGSRIYRCTVPFEMGTFLAIPWKGWFNFVFKYSLISGPCVSFFLSKRQPECSLVIFCARGVVNFPNDILESYFNRFLLFSAFVETEKVRGSLISELLSRAVANLSLGCRQGIRCWQMRRLISFVKAIWIFQRETRHRCCQTNWQVQCLNKVILDNSNRLIHGIRC